MPEYSLTFDPTADVMPYQLRFQGVPAVDFSDARHAMDALAFASDNAHLEEPFALAVMAAEDTQRFVFQEWLPCGVPVDFI